MDFIDAPHVGVGQDDRRLTLQRFVVAPLEALAGFRAVSSRST